MHESMGGMKRRGVLAGTVGQVFIFSLCASACAILLAACGGRSGSIPEKAAVEPSSLPANGGSPVPVSSDRSTSRLVVGEPEPGLQFEVPADESPAAGFVAAVPGGAGPVVPGKPAKPGSISENVTIDVATSSVSASSASAASASSAAAVATTFADALAASKTDVAFSLLTSGDQSRIGSPLRFIELLGREPQWLGSKLDPAKARPDPKDSSDDASIALRVEQQPLIDDVRGVVAPVALVTLPMRRENDAWKVRWERRSSISKYGASEDRLAADVLAWATARQKACTKPTAIPDSEYAGGLVGSPWLADLLCKKSGAPVIGEISDIYALANPQPILDSFGSSSYDWARVVTLTAPQPMDVIAAPFGDKWMVVGISPVRDQQ